MARRGPAFLPVGVGGVRRSPLPVRIRASCRESRLQEGRAPPPGERLRAPHHLGAPGTLRRLCAYSPARSAAMASRDAPARSRAQSGIRCRLDPAGVPVPQRHHSDAAIGMQTGLAQLVPIVPVCKSIHINIDRLSQQITPIANTPGEPGEQVFEWMSLSCVVVSSIFSDKPSSGVKKTTRTLELLLARKLESCTPSAGEGPENPSDCLRALSTSFMSVFLSTGRCPSGSQASSYCRNAH